MLSGFIKKDVLTHKNANVNDKHVFSHKLIMESLKCPENSQMFKVHLITDLFAFCVMYFTE